ncbi:MAG TPA: hypothetical protein VIP28_15355 [Nocardioides sp.]
MRRAAHNVMTGLMVGGLLSLLVAVSMSVTAPAANAAPADVWHVTIWEDDPALAEGYCRQAVIDYAPAVCHVEPEWMAPDPSMTGWAA